ncbi:hypothetical protein [Saccharicrinis sp. GN24d3]|uniref:hypothetical protein n=1 Tax=Saccharicrinis sp. GN24d3 TaxID=3458416 RepID=UPI0040353955
MRAIFSALLTEAIEKVEEEKTVELAMISINYNSNDWEYLSQYSGYNVISTNTVTVDESPIGTLAANTGLDYDKANNELIVVQTPNLPTLRFNRNVNLVETMGKLSTQGLAYDSDTDRYYHLTTSGITAKRKDNTILFVLTFPNSQNNPGSIYWSSILQMFLITYDGSNYIRFWRPDFNNNTLELDRELVVNGASEGVSMDERNSSIWVNGVDEKLKVSLGGQIVLTFPFGLGNTGHVNEGLALDPTDGTLWFNSDEYYHGGILGGNRLWHIDPEKKYNKYINVPDQIKWEFGSLVNAKIVDNKLLKINPDIPAEWHSPVFDMNSYEDIKLLEKYSIQPSAIYTSDLEPTSQLQNIFPFNFYQAWGDTNPNQVELSGILRFVQFKFDF